MSTIKSRKQLEKLSGTTAPEWRWNLYQKLIGTTKQLTRKEQKQTRVLLGAVSTAVLMSEENIVLDCIAKGVQ